MQLKGIEWSIGAASYERYISLGGLVLEEVYYWPKG
jgi:hypothetical protein